MHGYGIYYFNNGNKYIGEWKRNNFDGFGKFYYKSLELNLNKIY